MKRNRKSIILCNLALIFVVVIMIVEVQMISWIYKNMENMDWKVKGKLFLIVLILTLIGAILLLLRDYVKDILNNTYQDVTGIHNKKSLEKKIQQLKEKDDTLDIGVMIFDLNNLKQINDQYGHERGDEFIQSFASCLTRIITSNSFLARFGGDEFIIIQERTSLTELERMEKKLQSLLAEYNEKTDIRISYAVGYDVSYKNHYFLIEDLMDAVDKKMYQDKAQKKNVQKSICNDCPGALVTIPAVPVEVLASKIHEIICCSTDKHYAILMSDIENFHFINESYGYKTGNELLDILAKEFSIFENTVMSHRFHTDVFISIVDVTEILKEDFLQRVEKRNFQIVDMIKEKYPIAYLRINTGIRFIETRDTVPENMISFANLARRRAKEYANHICVFTELLNREEKMKREMLYSFQKAMVTEEFKILFQPKIDAKTMHICGAEVLVRWKKEDGTVWRPDMFIPLFEKTGFIVDLDFYVYEKAFQWMKARKDRGEKQIPLSVNVSRVHLKEPEKFTEKVFELLMKYQIDTKYIIFEITESIFMEQPEVINNIIRKFHEREIRFSMDDFGTGYSSLNTLKDILFDEIKIDKRFFMEELSENGKIVLQEIFHMLKRMNKSIVCEGVEKKEVSEFLVLEGCDEMQGFLFYRPMEIDLFQNELIKSKPVCFV